MIGVCYLYSFGYLVGILSIVQFMRSKVGLPPPITPLKMKVREFHLKVLAGQSLVHKGFQYNSPRTDVFIFTCFSVISLFLHSLSYSSLKFHTE